MRLENITKKFGNENVLNGITEEINEGITLITGDSGIGKTTLVRIIAGLERPDSGSVTGAGRISFLFQEDRLFPHLTAKENIAVVCSDEEKVNTLLSAVMLSDSKDKYPGEMSGGMNRRVAIARALAYEADTYIFDEPLKGLDPNLKNGIARLIAKATKDKQTIIVTHEPEDFGFCPHSRFDLQK